MKLKPRKGKNVEDRRGDPPGDQELGHSIYGFGTRKKRKKTIINPFSRSIRETVKQMKNTEEKK